MSVLTLLAQASLTRLMEGPMFWVAVTVIVVVMMAFMLILMLARQYRRCPSNRVLVIYGRTGKGRAATTIHGGAAFVVPLIQDYEYLSLEPIQIEIPLRGALSAENIRVNVPSVFTVAISTEPAVMQQAAIRLLGLSTDKIRKQAEEIIFGILRQVIAGMGIEEINRDRDKFLQHIQLHLESELNKIGLQLINVNITDITDESGYIDAIGQKAASEAIQKARGDVADNVRMGEIRVAGADRDKAIQVASATREQSIGTREAQRDQIVRLAELEKEQKFGEERAAFERETLVKDAERTKRVKVAEADAAAMVGEKEAERSKRVKLADADAAAIEGENSAQAKIVASQAELAVKRAEAYQVSEARKREAEAAVLEVQNRAMAKAALAEAERVEAEQRAKLEAPAKAQKSKIMVDAEAEAERIRINAKAEADAIFARLEAEARGQYEILAKKGEGLKQIVDACGGSNAAFQMMMLEHLDNLAEASSRAISNIKFDKIVVWENGGENGRSNTADFIRGMAKTLPPMMQVMKDIGGVELPESLIRFTEGDAAAPSTNGKATAETAQK
ncbi:flotillin family protein [Planctomicrobium piriforme]|uniref:Flotillin n=1 Tax=Planctomicrobium piriforme TaxID=1576369 RepID=A0A1I3G810_9PLAN|nr:flotillin family protein [Planctomicrobium piriforme]SFI19301.1 flotillin [Planctomicrobium piriforme]